MVIGTNPRAAAIAAALAVPATDTVAGHADLVVVCVEDYSLVPRLPGDADIVNLTSGTSEDAARTADLFPGRYLDGALMAHPEHVGRPETVIVYSGSPDVFARTEKQLARLGSATYLGPAAGTASLYDAAMLNFAWATLTGYLQTAALLTSEGVAARAFTPMLNEWMRTTVAAVIDDYADQIDTGQYPGDEEWLELDEPLMRDLITVTEQRGMDAALPKVVQDLTARGIAAGHGAESFASLVEVIRGGGPGAEPATA